MPLFSEIKSRYKNELSDLHSESEIKQLLKLLSVKILEMSDSEYLLLKDDNLDSDKVLRFDQALNRLQNNEPLQHILGTELFYELQLKVDNRALIPRPETEELVRWVVSSQNANSTVMDLCAGSGCIALAVKSELREAKVVAAELSPQAIELIKENIELTNVAIEVVRGDVLTADFYDAILDDSYDCWVSNPPYIPNSEKNLMSNNVLDYEPHMALFVEDNDPLIFYREIARNALNKLKKNGSLFFEIHENLADGVITILKDFNFVNIELRKDLQGKNRMIRAIK